MQSHVAGEPSTEYGAHIAGNETYEMMMLHDQEFLCTIPNVSTSSHNDTSEAEARAEEQKELTRATDRGWELLQDLERNCLYFIDGWWSYSFCYNSQVTQFHQLPPQPGRPHYPPQRDPKTAQYVLGRVRGNEQDLQGDYVNEVVEMHTGANGHIPPRTEIQAKGDTRYLVQRMEGGTTCDLTGRPRRIEIQYHCSPQASDRIGWIKEVTTCSYLMVIYTPRLCNDIAFQPPKENKANIIECRMVTPLDEMSYWEEQKMIEAEIMKQEVNAENPLINIGGTIVGGQKYFGKDGNFLPLPKGFSPHHNYPAVPVVDIIARAKGDGTVEVLSEEALEKLDLDPEVIDQLKSELQNLAGDKGWRLEVVETPGEVREIRGIVDDNDDEESPVTHSTAENPADASAEDATEKTVEGNNEGSEETYKEDL